MVLWCDVVAEFRSLAVLVDPLSLPGPFGLEPGIGPDRHLLLRLPICHRNPSIASTDYYNASDKRFGVQLAS